MKTVYLIRHAAYSNPNNILPGRLPLPLSDEGIEQAKKLASNLSSVDLEVIYSSKVFRAEQTAEIIQLQQKSKPEIKFDKRILETHSSYQGYWGQNVFEGGVHFFAHRDELGGESLEDIQQRVVSFWNEEVVAGSKDMIAIVSHDFCLLALIKYLNNLPLPESNKFNEGDVDYLPKAGMCKVVMDGGVVEVGDIIKL